MSSSTDDGDAVVEARHGLEALDVQLVEDVRLEGPDRALHIGGRHQEGPPERLCAP